MTTNGAIPWGDARSYAMAIARKRGLQQQDAEDVAQEVIIKVWRHRADVDNWRTYLYTAVVNQVTQHHRYHSHRAHISTDEVLPYARVQPLSGGQHPMERDPAIVVGEQETLEETLRLFAPLLKGAMLRIVLLLASGLDYRQCAARLGCTEVNIRVNKHRAKRKLLAVYGEVTR